MSGLFSLTHMGGGTFLYSVDRKSKRVVGKVELGRRKYRLPGILALAIGLPVLFFAVKNMDSGVEASVTRESQVVSTAEGNMDLRQLEERTEELKNDILSPESTAPVEAEGNGIQIHNYTIQSGDTLSALAKRYKVGVDLIAASSGIKSYSVLRPGQVLHIPSKPGLVYEMKSGDTIAALAQKYQVKVERILEDNPELADLDLLDKGVTVFLPDAKIPDPPSPWHRPAWGRLTSGFGWRRHPILGYRQKHTGLDIGIYYGPVRAARDGRVIYAGRLGSYGNTVVIQHNSQFKTLYAHLSKIRVHAGQWVKSGTTVAISGNTGLSTGPHLHFEVIKNGKSVNPRRFVRF